MATIVDICNMAIGELRGSPIVNITDSNVRAEACNAFFDADRQYVLRQHTWNFAIKRTAQLTAEVTSPEFGFSYFHLLPTDYIRMVGVWGDSTLDRLTSEEYTIEDGKIASDKENLYLRYVYDNEDTTMFDPLFIKVLSLKLATSIALQITGNSTLKKEMHNAYLMALEEAKAVDGQDRPPTVKMVSGMKIARKSRYKW